MNFIFTGLIVKHTLNDEEKNVLGLWDICFQKVFYKQVDCFINKLVVMEVKMV